MLALLEGFPRPGLARGQRREARAQALLSVAHAHELGGQALTFAGEPGIVRGDQRQAQIALLRLQRLVLLRLLRLALERSELSAHLVHDVTHAHEVLAGGVELALGFVALLLVARDPGGLLDEHAALVRLRREHVVELVLVHHRVRAWVGAGAGEEVEDVTQAGQVLVEEVLALARPVEPATHCHLGPRHREHAVVAEGQLDLGESDRLP